MPTMTLDIPIDLISALRRSPDEFLREMRLAAAVHWNARGVISQERAAELAGLDRTDFLKSSVAESAVVNASPLIYRARAACFDLLRVASDQIVVPASVENELTARGE